MKTENICEKCEKYFNRTIASYQNKPRFCSMQCRGHTGFRPGGQIRNNELTDDQRFDKLKKSFEKHVLRKDGCWDWKGKFEKLGYSKMSCRSSLGARHAHRASYLIHIGEIPINLQVNHRCNNRKCSNPDHLYLGTQKQNIDDVINSDHQAKGSKNGNSKLKENQVVEIKKLIDKGVSSYKIGNIHGVTGACILNIKNGKTWKHVEV